MVHKTKIRTRFCESDALGHINNVSFFIYLEQARVDFFIDLKNPESTKDWTFVLASINCDFKKQAFINQNLIVTTTVSHIGHTSIKLRHKIFDELTEELIAEGEEVLVQLDFVTQKSQPLSEEMVEKLKIYLNDI